MARVRIEVQNQFGEWRYLSSVTGLGPAVQRALEAALRSPMGRVSGKARAVDEDSGMVVDMVTA